jgi:hypothetical protein
MDAVLQRTDSSDGSQIIIDKRFGKSKVPLQ